MYFFNSLNMSTILKLKKLSPLTSLYQIQFDKKFKYDQRYTKTWIRTTKFFKKRRFTILKKKNLILDILIEYVYLRLNFLS